MRPQVSKGTSVRRAPGHHINEVLGNYAVCLLRRVQFIIPVSRSQQTDPRLPARGQTYQRKDEADWVESTHCELLVGTQWWKNPATSACAPRNWVGLLWISLRSPL